MMEIIFVMKFQLKNDFIILGINADPYYNKTDSNLLRFGFLLAVGVILYGLYQMSVSKQFNYISYPHPVNGHLIWDFPNIYTNVIYPVCIVIALLMIRPPIFLTFIMLFFALTAYRSVGNVESAGSYWCWLVASFSFIIYFANPYLQG